MKLGESSYVFIPKLDQFHRMPFNVFSFAGNSGLNSYSYECGELDLVNKWKWQLARYVRQAAT